jgi:hypothetical protein
VAKPNYGQVKRQKEAARKLRQQKKLDRRQARVGEPGDADQGDQAGEGVAVTAVAPEEKTSP